MRTTAAVLSALAAVLCPLAASAQDDLGWLLADEPAAAAPQATTAPTASAAPTPVPEVEAVPSAAEQAPLDVIPVPQPSPTPDARVAGPRNRLVEEIVVTAQKREESLQDVPISVQAFSGELLDALGVTDQTDLQRITPGLNITTQVSYVMTFLRGIGTDATIAAEPSVATYIDGIYYPFASNLAQNFGAVDRIEVLKGPQGTLFGRNATGGAIAIYTEEPDLDGGLSGELMTNISSFDTQMYRAHVNLPLTDWFGLNATAVTSRTDGWYNASYGTPAEPMPGDEMTGYRIKARLRPIDTLDIRLAAFQFEQESYNGSAAFTSDPSSLLGALIPAQPGYEGSVDSRPYNITDDNTVYYGSVTWNAPWFDVKLLGSDQRMDTAGLRDFDGSRLPLSTFVTPSQYIDAQSAELQLLSNGEAGPDWLEWILGAYYFRSTMGFGGLDFFLAGVDLVDGTLLGIPLPRPLVNILRRIPDTVAPTGAINMTGLVGTDSRALFSQATFALADWFSLTLGGRYQVEERYIAESTVGLGTADGGQDRLTDNTDRAVDGDGNPYPSRDRQKDFSPKVTFEFRPFDDDTLLFLSWQQAVKAATYNTIVIYTRPNYVEPEEIEAFEIGLKTSAFDGLVRFNAAAFHYNVENLQTYYLSLLAGGVISFQNAGQARIVGADFDGLIQLFPSLVDDLVLSGGAAYLDTEYVDFGDASGFSDNGTFVPGQDYSGNELIRTPKFTTTLSLSKTWQVPGGPLETVVDGYYTGDFYYEASNREASKQASYWLIGARLSYLYERWNLRATAGVRNLTDEFYTAGFFATDFGVQPTLAPPRSYYLQMIWNF